LIDEATGQSIQRVGRTAKLAAADQGVFDNLSRRDLPVDELTRIKLDGMV
jgi:hypothetical protein